MGYYYDHLDLEKLSAAIVRAGRAGHQIRNYAHSLLTFGYPEIAVVDETAGGVEGLCRQMRAQIETKVDIKYILREAVKTTVFMRGLVAKGPPEYIDPADKVTFTEVLSLTDLMISSFREADSRVNWGIMRDTQICFGDAAPSADIKIFASNPAAVAKLESEFRVENSQFLKFESPAPSYDLFKAANMKLGRLLCNKAHQIQDVASVHNESKRAKEHARKVIQVAGQIENQSREVQRKLQNYGRVHKKYERLMHQLTHHCENIAARIEDLEKISTHPDCPLKLTEAGPFAVLLQMEIGLWRILRNNATMGFK